MKAVALRNSVLGLALFLGATTEGATTVWIDTDPAIGAPWREVDDAFALLLALRSPELRIAGVSTTYGNAGLARTTEVARGLVRRFGAAAGLKEGDVHPGAESARDAREQHAAGEALARALRERRMTYIALGPLTNLATFLARYPEMAHRIERVIFVGGRSPEARFAFGPAKRFAVHDANVSKDTDAVETLLKARVPLLVVPIEIAPQLALTVGDLRRLRGGAAGDYLFRRTRVWAWFWRHVVGEEGGLVFDVLAILPVVQSGLLETEARFVALDGNDDLVAYRTAGRGRRRVQFATEVNPRAKAMVLERLR